MNHFKRLYKHNIKIGRQKMRILALKLGAR